MRIDGCNIIINDNDSDYMNLPRSSCTCIIQWVVFCLAVVTMRSVNLSIYTINREWNLNPFKVLISKLPFATLIYYF